MTKKSFFESDVVNDYGVRRNEVCRELNERIACFIKDAESLRRKAYYGQTVEPDERLNIENINISMLENELQMIRRNVIEIEKINAVLDVLRDM